MMTYLRLRYWIVGAGMLVCFFAPNNSFGTGPEEVVYEFPPHFKGWVLIQWEDPACAALPSKPGSIHIPIPESGCACTSDLPLFGFRPTRYERIHLDGTKEVLLSRLGDDSSDIRSHITGMGPSRAVHQPLSREAFFVGNKQEYMGQYKLNPLGPQFPEQKICEELDGHASRERK